MAKTKDKKGAESSLSALKEKKGAVELPSKPVEFNGKKYLALVPSLHRKGKDYTAEEFLTNEEVMKFLVEETFNRHGNSAFIKEVFE